MWKRGFNISSKKYAVQFLFNVWVKVFWANHEIIFSGTLGVSQDYYQMEAPVQFLRITVQQMDI